jgi:hypothetical protein|tara:strand:- start:74 stop:631 length:558 start_codon:yes stop_codon:yes gene_type:complete
MKKLILLVCLMVLAGSAMAKDYPYVGDCPVWRTAANGDLVCATSSGNNSSGTNQNNNQNNQPNHNQGCGGFNQQQCGWPHGQPMSPWQHQQVKATGRDAVNIILNSDMLASGMTADGWTRYTVRYTGTDYTRLQGVVFNCKAAPNGREFECVNWLPPKPKQVQFGNGNWSVIFELLNQYQQKKNQ